jgi:hypothetical protein
MVQATGRQRPDRGTIDDLRLDPRSAITRGPYMDQSIYGQPLRLAKTPRQGTISDFTAASNSVKTFSHPREHL